jgi:hypothetical protein
MRITYKQFRTLTLASINALEDEATTCHPANSYIYTDRSDWLQHVVGRVIAGTDTLEWGIAQLNENSLTHHNVS